MNAQWKIAQLDCYPEFEGHADVVFTAHWRVEATDGDYNASVYGTIGLTLDTKSPYTPYADLTEEQVVGWVKDAMGNEQVLAIGENLANQIADQKNPKVVSPALPWTV